MGIDVTSAHVHVVFNTPDQLSCCFDSVADALEYLRAELRGQQNEYFQQCQATDPARQERGSDCCGWCEAAYDIEAILAAIADRDAHYWITQRGTQTWTIHPPHGVSLLCRVELITEPRSVCDLANGA